MTVHSRPIAAIVMGPSGVGKTTTAKGIAERLGWVFAEADEFHPKANIDKMSAGIPLNDEDRAPWLRLIRDWITREAEAGRSVVVTCSALKKAYRDVLREADADVRFIELDAPIEVIGERMARRKGHYMPASLLKSQYETLEPLLPEEAGSVVSVEASPEKVIAAAIAALQQG
ncbi:gluconokinase [Aureimonas frigidaquae]|uniref:Gluconokinase n=1 Tax=Aureimonas frigidaquae TaxID=424757 RepID=A0A0P0Z0X2_9HYPH|nr:gluconokinase [Aureimonas frigidaquae]BAT27508.1 carbohydrate kinase, thermoresistant gluconokinase [Aureimonas frigidaquae]